MLSYSRFSLWLGIALAISLRSVLGAPETIDPGALWLDDQGKHVQAHGGGVIKLGSTYYWFGEDRSKDNDSHFRYVACYSSQDLAHWKFCNKVVKIMPSQMDGCVILERPKVFFNEKSGKYVMYAHVDSGNYQFARVGVFICDKVDGDYKFVRSFRPLGQVSRDLGQFIDDDGTAYLIFEDRINGFHIAKLSDDYLDVAEDVYVFRKEDGGDLEGGCVVHDNGTYYAVGSQLSGWGANPNKYASAPSLKGPWTRLQDIAPPALKTYGSQSSMLLKVTGSQATTIIFMGDIWKPNTQYDSRYLWMPLDIKDGKLSLPPPKPWTLDVATGVSHVP